VPVPRRPTGGRLDEAALSLAAKPVAVAPDGQHMTVVQEWVEDCGRDDRIGEYDAPFSNAAVRSDQHGARFVAIAPSRSTPTATRCRGS
jgi:hypothetical protein